MAQSSEQLNKKKSVGLKIKLLLGLVVFLVLVLVGLILYFQYVLFKTKAEGIAIGYKKAIVAAYQAQRPLPNTIFEEGNYRVEVNSQQTSSGQIKVSIAVRDKYSNVSHFNHEDTIALTQQIPMSMPQVQSIPAPNTQASDQPK
ncbi:MAG: hypothetical protein U0457_13655 [Candidatus Sericytochromatia bacterium]